MDPLIFNRSTLQQRLDVLAEAGAFIIEECAPAGHTLFFSLDHTYVAMHFPAESPGTPQVIAFNRHHPLFEHLVGLIPVDPQVLLSPPN